MGIKLPDEMKAKAVIQNNITFFPEQKRVLVGEDMHGTALTRCYFKKSIKNTQSVTYIGLDTSEAPGGKKYIHKYDDPFRRKNHEPVKDIESRVKNIYLEYYRKPLDRRNDHAGLPPRSGTPTSRDISQCGDAGDGIGRKRKSLLHEESSAQLPAKKQKRADKLLELFRTPGQQLEEHQFPSLAKAIANFYGLKIKPDAHLVRQMYTYARMMRTNPFTDVLWEKFLCDTDQGLLTEETQGPPDPRRNSTVGWTDGLSILQKKYGFDLGEQRSTEEMVLVIYSTPESYQKAQEVRQRGEDLMSRFGKGTNLD